MSNTDKTNVLFILSDDQGPWAAGCCGNSEIRTPNIDRLAKTGVRFSNFFVASPVCSASSATLLAGRIPSRHGVHEWIRGGNVGPDAIRYLEGEEGYTDIMARHGWTCGLSGKWHLGDSQIPKHGFMDWSAHQRGGGHYQDAPMVKNGQLLNEPRYLTDAITDEGLEILERYADRNHPFYWSLHYTASHDAWVNEHPQSIVDSYDDCPFKTCPQEPCHPWAGVDSSISTDDVLGNREALKGYFAAVTAMDQNIGRILDRLEELGLRDNTLVVFLSDNGFSCGHHGFWGKGNGTMPRNMYENSIKVPAIFSQPGRIPQGVVSDSMVSAYDFMPTLLEYLDLPVPEGRNLPSSSFLSAPESRPFHAPEQLVAYDEYDPVRMVRTPEWKYTYRHSQVPHELYHLVTDPGERKNLAQKEAQTDRIEELRGMPDDWFGRYVDSQRNGLSQDGMSRGQTEYLPYTRPAGFPMSSG